jgi:hypothetical protein
MSKNEAEFRSEKIVADIQNKVLGPALDNFTKHYGLVFAGYPRGGFGYTFLHEPRDEKDKDILKISNQIFSLMFYSYSKDQDVLDVFVKEYQDVKQHLNGTTVGHSEFSKNMKGSLAFFHHDSSVITRAFKQIDQILVDEGYELNPETVSHGTP